MTYTPATLHMARLVAQAVLGAEMLPPESNGFVRMTINRYSKETLERMHRVAMQVLAGRETRDNLRREFGDHEPGDDA